MIFASPFFLQIFLPLLLLLYFAVFRSLSWRNHLLVAASILFYAWGEPELVVLLLASIAVNYLLAVCFLRPQCAKPVRLAALAAGILLNLGLLAACKYLIPVLEFLEPRFRFQFMLPVYHLPLGISFYTFQIISYLIDTWRNVNAPQRNLEKLALFVALFPQLVAGPIIKYHDLEPELSDRRVTISDFAIGLRRFILGLSKKVLLANFLAVPADDIFEVPLDKLDTITAWTGAICYTLQIYFDFSGYSDMAIGLGRMFGFHFCENFNYPYCSASVREFWRRWHISLSTWFKEYLYIPLGGNRCSKFRWNLNILIVFLVTGIWHGAAWNFVLWGVLYGVLIVLENSCYGQYLDRPLLRPLARVYTLLAVIFAWVLFRADSIGDAVRFCGRMVCWTDNPALHLSAFFTPFFGVILLVAVACCAPLPALFPNLCRRLREEPVTAAEVVLLPLLLAAVLLLLAGNTYNPFIYFRF